MNRVAIVLVCLGLASCTAAADRHVRAVNLGETVTLAPGEAASVEAVNLVVRFVSVTEDSRCARDTTCIWAGEVRVKLEIRRAGKTSAVELLEGGSIDAGAHHLTLVRVEPLPSGAARIAQQDYRVTLQMDQAD